LAAVSATTTGSLPSPSNAATTESMSSRTNVEFSTTQAATIIKTTDETDNRKTLEESISGFIAGASLAASKTIVKYPLDTATVRLQMPNSDYSIGQPGRLLNGSFRGITFPLISNIPAGAVFFAVKDATKEFLKTSSAGSADLPRWATTSLAVLAATFPYMLVRNPSEVIKTRQQAGIEGYGEGVSALEAFQKVKQGATKDKSNLQQSMTNNVTAIADTVGNFYVGYWENVLYTYPADVIKFVTYENLSGGRKNLQPLAGAVYGAMSTATAQLMTTPLDVVRNRVMAGKGTAADDDDKDLSYLQSLSKIAQEEGVAGLFAGVSPRVGKAILSGAIQFATYEETKQKLTEYFQKR
jgi:solute carrier family 25 S-adenosylmethionine transporter 26